jgi:hypothetical protein
MCPRAFLRLGRLVVLALLPACNDLLPKNSDAGVSSCTCLALGRDEERGGLAISTRVDLPSRTVSKGVVRQLATSVPPEFAVRRVADTAYLLNGFGDGSIAVLDRDWQPQTVFTVGEGVVVRDIAVQGTTAYVAVGGRPEVQVFDLESPGKAKNTIPMDLYARVVEGDADPDLGSIFVTDGKIFVSLLHLDKDRKAAAKGEVVAIELAKLTHTAIDLTYRGPRTWLARRLKKLVVATEGWDGAGGCLEELLVSGTPTLQGCALENSILGGTITGLVEIDDRYTYLAATEAGGQAAAIRGLGDQGVLDREPVSRAGQFPTDLAYCPATSQLLANDRAGGGLRVYSLQTGKEVTETPLELGEPPVSANGIVCL